MARRDASISIALDAQTAQLERKIEESTKDIQGLNTTLLNTEAALDIAARAMSAFTAIVETAASAVEFLNDRVLGLAEIGLDAVRTGLDPTVLEDWQRAARLAGVEADTLTESAFELTKRLGEARAEGQGTAFEAFGRLGIDVNQAFTPEQLTNRVLGTLQQTRQGNQALADFLADELLGDMGRELIPLISQWNEVMSEAGDRVAGLGRATEKTFLQAEQYRRELEQTKNMFSEIADALTREMIPAMNAFLIGTQVFVETLIISGRQQIQSAIAYFRAIDASITAFFANMSPELRFALELTPGFALIAQPFRAFRDLAAASAEAAELELERLDFFARTQIGAPDLPTIRPPSSIGITTRERGGFAEAARLRKQQEDLQRAQLRQLQRIGDNTEVLPQPADL